MKRNGTGKVGAARQRAGLLHTGGIRGWGSQIPGVRQAYRRALLD